MTVLSGVGSRRFSRRRFLKLGSAAAVVAVVAGVGGYFTLQQPTAPPPSSTTPTSTPAPAPTPTPTPTPTQGRILLVPQDYAAIDEAIAAASAGDTIQVGPGVFPPFNIDKPLTITGAGAGVSIIRGEREDPIDLVVGLSTNGASVSGFTIESDIIGAAFVISGSRNRVSGNTIDSAGTGFFITDGDGNELSNNTITSDGPGVSISFGAIENRVSDNTIKSGSSGVAIADNKNHVIGNSIEAGESGVIVAGGSNNEIRGNTIKRCSKGIIVRTEGNTIFENNLIDNEVQAQDNGSNNGWFKDGRGNHWSGWTSPDENGDGIVDTPYAIAGEAGSVDRFPLVSPFQSGGQQSPPPAAVKSFTFTVRLLASQSEGLASHQVDASSSLSGPRASLAHQIIP